MKRFTLLILLLYIATIAWSQGNTVTGKVTSNNEPLPFVSVAVKGKTIGTTSDIDGNFSLSNIGTKDVLVFTFIGYQSKEVTVGNQTIINISLEEDVAKIDEVVVTALGIKRQKRAIGYSTEKVESELLNRANTSNVVSAMTGRAAGVQISNGDGTDGGSTRITIRGNNNISDRNQPLIVIDGVQMENTSGQSDIGRGQDWGSPINNINPEDIAEMNVLKGGAASALYGSRGANGVIEITTKKGAKQEGIGVSYSVSLKVKTPYRYRDVQNKYGAGGPISLSKPTFSTDEDGNYLYPGVYSTDNLLLNEEGETSSSNAEFGYYGGAVSWGPEMDGRMVKWWDGEMRSYSPQPDNMSMFYNTGYTKTHNIALSGGSDKGTVRVSVTHKDHTPIIDNSNFKQTTLNLGSSLKVSEKLRVDVSANYIDYNRFNSPILGESGDSFNKGILYSWPRSYKGLDMQNYQLEDGSRNPMENYPFAYVNPDLWWNYYKNNETLQRNKFLTSVSTKYDINSWLFFTWRSGLDYTNDNFVGKNAPTDILGLENGSYSNSLLKSNSMNHDFMFTANKDKVLGSNINLEVSVGGARNDRNVYGIAGTSGKWINPNFYSFQNQTPYEIINGEVIQTGEYSAFADSVYTRRTNSVYSFLNLSYKNYLFAQFTGRNDWSSTLPADNNSYFYPSASLSYVITEAFDFSRNWLNFWKIRGAAAQTATDDEPYRTEFYYGTSMFGGNQTSGFPNTIPPYALKPQRVNSYEVGTTVGMFNNRIDIDLTYYYMHSFDQIITSPLPVSSGANYVQINNGVITNRGIELILNTVPYQSGNWVVKSSLNFTRNRNKVNSLGADIDQFIMAEIWGLNGPAMVLSEGDDFGTISGYDYVYHENGQPILSDDGTTYKITDQRVPIGNASPDFLAGWNTEVRYRNWSLSALIDTKWGGDIYSGSYVIGLQTGQSPETLVERDGGGLPYTDPEGNTTNVGVILPGVYEDGEANDKVVHYYYKYMPNAGGWGKVISTPGIVENTWIKCREIALEYRLPKEIARKTKVFQELTFSIVGRDLFYIYSTVPDNINPEGIMGSGNAQGFEWSAYPGTRSFIFGIQAKF